MNHISYRQLNKDYAYWTEKRQLGQAKGGQVSGLLSHTDRGGVKQNILFDCGLGTLEAIADFCPDSFWDEPLVVFITHGHIDHHAELMILSEIYTQRRGKDMFDIRPALKVYCTKDTQKHLRRTHFYGYTGSLSLEHVPIYSDTSEAIANIKITPLAVDHFEGAVIFVITFKLSKPHKIIIGWDMTSVPLAYLEELKTPSLALFEATTWTSMSKDSGHSSVEDLVDSQFLENLQLCFQPEQEYFGAYFVHYSGWEDPQGMLTDEQLKEEFDAHYPQLAEVVRVAERGQLWTFS